MLCGLLQNLQLVLLRFFTLLAEVVYDVLNDILLGWLWLVASQSLDLDLGVFRAAHSQLLA